MVFILLVFLVHYLSLLVSSASSDEVGFIHTSQISGLNQSEVNPSDAVFWNRDHKLGISTHALLPLYNAAKHAFMASREQYKIMCNLSVKRDGYGEHASDTSSPLISLEDEIMKHSKVLLLISCDFGTAWNSRKEIVSQKHQFPLYIDELLFSSLVLSGFPKSERAWSHRRWVIKMIAGNCSNLCEILDKESELVKKIAEKSKMNYRAWNHRSWLVSYMPANQALDELTKNQDWAGLHVADNSCFHYRTRLMLRMLDDSAPKQDGTCNCPGDAELSKVWKEELEWNQMLIKRYIGREALWLYRRFLSICWLKYFAADDKISPGVGMFMKNEMQLFSSCAIIPDNVFEDYQSQATFSATYLLWLIKHMYDFHGFEPQKEPLKELKALLDEICPEKAFLLDLTRTKNG